MKRVAVLIKNIEKKEDALRTVQGFNDKGNKIELFVLEHDLKIFSNLFMQNRVLLGEITGCYSDNPLNDDQFNFQYAINQKIADHVKQADLIIPF